MRQMNFLKQSSIFSFAMCLPALFGISSINAQVAAPAAKTEMLLPASEKDNSAGWVLREDISDEFEGDKIDSSKWFVEGENGDYYIWKGRAPSQFAPHNAIVEDGKLKIRSQWEPDYNFARDEGHEGGMYGVHEGKDVPVTTAGVVSRKRFLNGYMEVRSKAGNAAMTAAFWAIGYESELDIYEQMGNPNAGDDITATSLKASVHDWQPPAKRPTRKFGYKKKLPYRVADDFHVYGCEWGEDYLKCFIDGELVYETTQAKEGKHWVLTNPLEIWLDSEVFRWLGIPFKEELPADFEIDYMRVWQKPHPNQIDRAFFGFEGPILFQQNPRPLTLKPESSVGDDYQKFWEIDEESSKNLNIVRHEKFSAGTRSLKFETTASENGSVNSVQAQSPAGAITIPDGDHFLCARVWIDPASTASHLQFSLADPKLDVKAFDLSDAPKGKWVALSQAFSRSQPSGDQDGLTVAIHNPEVSGGKNLIYIDEIAIRKTPAPQKKSADSVTEADDTQKTDDKAVTTKPAVKKKSASDKTKEEWIAMEKVKWEKNGWNWNQSKVESNFDEMDANNDGIATGLERKAWFKQVMEKKQ